MDLVITQAPVPPADPTAVIGRRTAAYLIDALIGIVLFFVVFAMVASSDERLSSFEAERICDQLNNNSSGYFCFNADTTVILVDGDSFTTLLLIMGIYFVATQLILPALTGFSPGKAIVGLRVVNQETFQKAGFGAHLVRWLLWVVDSAPWCFPLVALITGLSSNGHRRVGDMAANTVVIDKLWVGNPLAIAGVNSVVSVVAAAPAAPPFMAPGTASMPAAPGFGSPVAPLAPPVMPPAPGTTSTPPPPPPGATPPPPGFPPTPVEPPAPVVPSPEMDEGNDAGSDVDLDATTALVSEDISDSSADETAAIAPLAPPVAPTAPAPPAPPIAPPAPVDPTAQPGVDAPQWDAARDTYIQWDPDLAEWMEWNETAGAWVPISQ